MGTRSWGRRGKCYSALTVGSKGLRQTSKLQNFLGSCSKQSASVPVVDFECNFWSKLQKSSTEGNRCRCNWLLVPFTSCWVNASQVAAQRKRQPIFMLHSITVQKCLLVGPLRPSLIHMSPPVCISGWQDVDVMYFLQDAELWKRHQRASTSCSHFSGFHLTIRFNYNCENIWGALGVPAPWWRRFLLCWGSSWCGCPSLVSAESV